MTTGSLRQTDNTEKQNPAGPEFHSALAIAALILVLLVSGGLNIRHTLLQNLPYTAQVLNPENGSTCPGVLVSHYDVLVSNQCSALTSAYSSRPLSITIGSAYERQQGRTETIPAASLFSSQKKRNSDGLTLIRLAQRSHHQPAQLYQPDTPDDGIQRYTLLSSPYSSSADPCQQGVPVLAASGSHYELAGFSSAAHCRAALPDISGYRDWIRTMTARPPERQQLQAPAYLTEPDTTGSMDISE